MRHKEKKNKKLSMPALIENKPFWALFGTQFFGAYNDNFFRTALITLITFHLMSYSEAAKSIFVSSAFGVFTLPFFLFSPLAGQLADGFDKAKIIRWVKGSEVVIVSLSAYGFIHKDPFFLLGALFFMGVHSTFFGPAKYSILPEILPQNNLLSGNGFIEAGTFLAIMLGTLFGALLIHLQVPLSLISLQLLGIALAGFGISWMIPPLRPTAPRLKIRFSWLSEMKNLFQYARKDDRVFRAIIAIAWFWLVGTLLMAQLPSFSKAVIEVEESVFIFLLLLFTIGIGMGSILCNFILKGKITTLYVPLLSVLLFFLLLDLSCFSVPLASTTTSLIPFLTSFQGLRLSFDVLALSFIGGVYIVPLYAYIQTHAIPSQRSQVIAFSNIINAGFMVFISFSSSFLLSLRVSIPTLIFLTSLGQLIMIMYVLRILPDPALKKTLSWVLRFVFRLEVKGLENYQKAGEKVILIANHTSYIDALLIAASLPEKPVFAINLFTAKKWWVKPFLVLAKVIPVDPLYPYTLREVIEEAKKGHKVLIFPEGRLTLTGSLMKVYEGPGMVAEKSGATLLPMHIEGAQYTFFSLLKGEAPRKFFPKITVTILPPFTLSLDPSLIGKARRKALSKKIYDVMVSTMFKSFVFEKTLFLSLLKSKKLYGLRRPILQDASQQTLTYGTLLLKVFTFSRLFSQKTRGEERVGLMLPNSHALVVSFWALQMAGQIPALLNFTSGPRTLLTLCQLANINHVFTSHLLVKKERLQDEIILLKENKIHVHYLEDEVKKIGLIDKLWGLYGMLFPEKAYRKRVPVPAPLDPCVVLFTSGSEATPKGVVLSHTNLLANCYQLTCVVDFNGKDLVLNILPLFHAFGLLGMVLPLLSGIKCFHYISPLHYRVVAELVYDMGATILFGTDTFLFGYGRAAHPYDFHTLRYVFAGAEKLKEETQKLWFDKFGIRIFEGYGTTETSPVLSVNTPMHYKAETVGRFLPEISYRLDPIEGILRGGRLWVHGPNIMKGYISQKDSSFLIAPKEGWYDTGDIVDVDGEGYVHILGRAKRFAKVGGEILSLTHIEEMLACLWPGYLHAVVSRPYSKKGEKLVLFTEYPQAEKGALISFWKAQGLSELSLPKSINILPTIPLLSSGKVDYRALENFPHTKI